MWTELTDQFATVLHAFLSNKGRSLLTLLGMIIGAGSVVLLSGLLAGGSDALTLADQFIDDADVIEVEEGEPPPQQRDRPQRRLESADQEGLNGSAAVGGAGVEGELFDWSRWARVGSDKKRVLVLGASASAQEMYRVSVARGRFIDDEDLRLRRRVCVVGDEVWRELLGAPPDLGGRSLRVNGVRWEVIGALRPKPPLNAGPGTWMWDRRVVVPATTFQAAVRHSRRVDVLYVRLLPSLNDLAERVDATQRLLKSALLRRHYGVENFRVQGDKGEKQQRELIFTIINVLMLCTAALSLFVGGINIMNIMLVTVTERTREIGIRRALGATRGTILRQFMLESALIAGLGGLLGIVGGVAVVFVASKLLAAWLGVWTAHYQLWAIVLGLCSSTLTGVVFGLYPAWRAASMDPVTALRYE